MAAHPGAWSDASAYAASFGRLCVGTVARLLDTLPGGGTLLDVGTGPGAVLSQALQRGWDAHGVDPAPEMLALASKTISADRLCEARLPDLPFPAATFDAVTANFVINHVADPRAGVRELARVVKPTGAVAVTIWPSTISPMNALWNQVMAAADTEPAAGSRLPAGLDFERTPAGLHDLCDSAGLEVETVEEVAWTFSIGPHELWGGVVGGIGVIGQTYRSSTPAGRARLERAFTDLVEPGDDGLLHLPSVAILAVGRPRRTSDGA